MAFSEVEKKVLTEKAITAVSRVIDASNTEVLIVSGALSDDVYGSVTLQDSVKRAIDERHVRFDIIVGPKYDRNSGILKLVPAKDISVAPQWPDRHFVIGDKKHVRFEPSHEETDGLSAAANMVSLNQTEAAQILINRFNQLKPLCKPFEVESAPVV